jgi:hypothetical protein
VSFEALRYFDRKEGATLERRVVQLDPAGFRTFDRIRIPAKKVVTWTMADGDFTWPTMEITGASHN